MLGTCRINKCKPSVTDPLSREVPGTLNLQISCHPKKPSPRKNVTLCPKSVSTVPCRAKVDWILRATGKAPRAAVLAAKLWTPSGRTSCTFAFWMATPKCRPKSRVLPRNGLNMPTSNLHSAMIPQPRSASLFYNPAPGLSSAPTPWTLPFQPISRP